LTLFLERSGRGLVGYVVVYSKIENEPGTSWTETIKITSQIHNFNYFLEARSFLKKNKES